MPEPIVPGSVHRPHPQVRRAVVALALAAAATALAAQDRTAVGLVVDVPAAATTVAMDGRPWLSVELHIGNRLLEPLTLREVRITSADDLVARFDGAELERRLDHPAGSTGATIPAGGSRVLFVDAAFPARTRTGSPLHYEVRAVVGDADPAVTRGPIPHDGRSAVVLAPPLEGGPWVAVHHPDWERGHRRVFYTVDGVTRLPGRFTIDFVRVDEQGRTTRGDPDVVRDTLGYGAPVLAVADARVAAIRDDMLEPSRISARLTHAANDAAGNYIALDLGQGRFAVYEHLKPGSVRVGPGDRVRRGDRIAALGFTGDSTGPHLHLHVGDHPAPLAAEGLPYAFERFSVLGRYADIAAMGRTRWTTVGEGARTRERPAPNVVVDFGAGRRIAGQSLRAGQARSKARPSRTVLGPVPGERDRPVLRHVR